MMDLVRLTKESVLKFYETATARFESLMLVGPRFDESHCSVTSYEQTMIDDELL